MTAPHVVTPADLPAPYAGSPLRIAYVGNFRHPWCTEQHVAGSLESMGHTVLHWQEDECDWSFVPSNASRLGVQLLLWTRTWPAEMTTVEPVLKELAAEGIPTVSYHLDRWFGLDRAHQVDDQPFFRTSLVVSPDDSPKWAEHGVNHCWLPPGVYGPECEPVPPNPRRWPYDVVFVGSHPYPHPEWAKYRSDLLAAFSRAFRGRFGILPRRGVPIRGRDLQELYATVPVVLGDSCLAGESTMYWSDRCPESLGRGAFLIHPIVPGMEKWYPHLGPQQDLAGYNLGDFDQAVTAAKWALANKLTARRIGEHGRATVLARDTYAHRMATVLAVAEGIYGGYREVGEYDPEDAERAWVAEHGPAPAGKGWSKSGGRWDFELVNIPGFPLSPSLRPSRGLPVAPPATIEPHPYRWPALVVAGGPDGRPCTECGLADYHPIHQVATPRSVQRRVQLGRMSARFDLRADVPTDGEVLDEVWVRNDYRVDRRFSGTVVDIGANIGAFSVLAALNGAKRVVAYEPEAGNLDRLVHHMDLNHVAHLVTARAEAVVGDPTRSVHLVGTGGGAMTVDTMAAGGVCLPPGEVLATAPTVALAEVLHRIRQVEFLKVDVEGAEYAILDACPVDVLAAVERMAIEFHGPQMPHLAHLDDGHHLERWGAMVAKLADAGRVEIFGHPMRGGLIWWQRY